MAKEKKTVREWVSSTLEGSSRSRQLRIFAGVSVVALFVASSFFFQNAAQALKRLVSEGYTGYYNNAYYSTNADAVLSGSTYVASSKTSAPASLTATAGGA